MDRQDTFIEFERMVHDILEHKDQIDRIDFSSSLKNGTRFSFHFNQRTWERRQHPSRRLDHKALFNGIFDILTIGISIAVLVILVIYAKAAQNTNLTLAYTFFAISLIIYSTFSSLYHFFTPIPSTKQVFDRLKSMFRFCVVVITYAPVYLIYTAGSVGLTLFMTLFVLGAVGVFFTFTGTKASMLVARIISALMPLLILIALMQLIETFGSERMIILGFSSLLYALWGTGPLLWEHNDKVSVNFSNFFMLSGTIGFFWLFISSIEILL